MFMTTTKYGILVGIDGSPSSDAAIVWASHEAVMRNLPLTLLHAVPPVEVGWPVGRLYANMPEWQRENAEQVIAQARALVTNSLGDAASPELRSEIVSASVVPTLIEASKEAALVVSGSQGMGAWERLLLGSVTTGILHHAHCPVAVIHRSADAPVDPYAPVLVGIDGSPGSEAAIAVAFDEASRRGVELLAVHVWSDIGVFPAIGMDWRDRENNGNEVLAERLAGWQERYPDVSVQRNLHCDGPARWLLKEAQRAQLVVVGSHGRGGFTGMHLGSVAHTVAQSAHVPVMVVRGLDQP